MSSSIPASYDQMRMHLGLTVLQGDVSNEREELDLFLKLDHCLILLGLPVKPAEFDIAQGTDRLETAAGQMLRFERRT